MTEDDPWQGLRRWTPARIALGRTGDALPTRRVLEFQLAHAQARDAVHLALDVEGLARDLAPLSAVPVRSLAREPGGLPAPPGPGPAPRSGHGQPGSRRAPTMRRWFSPMGLSARAVQRERAGAGAGLCRG